MPGRTRNCWLILALAACGPTGGESSPSRTVADEVTPASTLPRTEAAAPADASAEAGDGGEPLGVTGEDPGTGEATGEATTAAAEEPEIVAPEGYGKVHFPVDVPDPDTLTMHGLAGYEVVAVYSRPDLSSPKLGYLRIGTRLKVTEKVGETDECKKGFHGLPMGGFVCAGKGFVVEKDKPPFMKYEIPRPALDQAHPYLYGFVRKWSSPMWWRIPTDTERAAAEAQRAQRESERTGTPIAAAGDTDGDAAASPTPGEPAADVKLPLSLATPWLERGFFLSLGEKIKEESRSYYRTARGAFVEAGDVSPYDAKDFKGVELGDEIAFPVAFVDKKETKLFALTDDNKLKAVKTLEKRDFIDVDEETEIGGKAYMITPDGHLVRKDHLAIPELQPLPKGLDPWERWVDVSLSKQMLVAYEGTRPVYVTLVSTGKKGTPEESFETPTGRWRIYTKHISTTMDGNTASDGNYSIQDVPWTMFFFGSYALHGAFWHRSFGHVRSHGCVNLGPSDARWLFFWTTPFLPEGWHGVHATDESPGSTVIVHA
ncbi:MAG: L,D-transpeptidase family protein [Nannocystaceae bacterium]